MGDNGHQEQTINEAAVREPIPMSFFTPKAQTALKNKSATQPLVVQIGYMAMARMFRASNSADKANVHSLHTIATFPTNPELCHLYNYTLTNKELDESRTMYLERQYLCVGTFLTGDSTSNEGMRITVKRNGLMMFRNTSRFDLQGGDKVYLIFPSAYVGFDASGKEVTAANAFLTLSPKLTAKIKSGILEWAPMITVPEKQFAQFVEHRLQTAVTPSDWTMAYQLLKGQCFAGEVEMGCRSGEIGSLMFKDP
jgi:hypothetical protein